MTEMVALTIGKVLNKDILWPSTKHIIASQIL